MTPSGFDAPLSALRAAQTGLDVTAHNLANLNTDGFKSSRAGLQDVSSHPPGGGGSSISSVSRDLSQGPLRFTADAFDLAVEGPGFLSVRRADGSLGFTRAGSFRVDGQGNVVTPGGDLLDPAIRVPDGTQAVSISADGRVTAAGEGGATQDLGTIQLTRFPNPGGLDALGGNLFRPTAASGGGERFDPGTGGVGALRSGFLEGSNVDLATEIVNLLVGQRTTEAQVVAVRTRDEIQQTILDLKR